MTNKGLTGLIVAQVVVTLALLGFAFAAHVDEQTRTLIIGAVIGHWLVESNNLRQAASSVDETTVAAASTKAAPVTPPAPAPPVPKPIAPTPSPSSSVTPGG